MSLAAPAGFRLRVGVDIVEVERVARLVDTSSDDGARIFTAGELEYCRDKPRRDEHLAARFAAKEAVLKAFGTGLTNGARWTDVEVVSEADGRPVVSLHGELSSRARREGLVQLDVSLSHTEQLAIAHAVALWRESAGDPVATPAPG
jgi:holo-[acyl-carrier protein] synthase